MNNNTCQFYIKYAKDDTHQSFHMKDFNMALKGIFTKVYLVIIIRFRMFWHHFVFYILPVFHEPLHYIKINNSVYNADDIILVNIINTIKSFQSSMKGR
jgi:hypothetical protein